MTRTSPLALIALGAALALSLGASACTKGEGAKAEGAGADPSGLPSRPAPAFETKNLEAEEVSLEDLKGTVVLLNTWATWCEPCMRELPVLADLHRSLEPRGFTVIGLNADSRRKLVAVRKAVAHNGIPYPVWVDFENEAQVAFELNGYPTSFLIDREGNIRWQREGVIVENDPEFMRALEQLL